MANRRMFSKDITNAGYFLMMPSSSQLLYFHLNMNADDDGFVEAYTVMNMIRASEGDLEWLIRKGFLELYDNLVTWIVGWRVNNEIRWDRYKESKYQYLKPGYDFKNPDKVEAFLGGIVNVAFGTPDNPTKLDELKTKIHHSKDQNSGSTDGTPSGSPAGTRQVRLGKDSIGKNIYIPTSEESEDGSLTSKTLKGFISKGDQIKQRAVELYPDKLIDKAFTKFVEQNQIKNYKYKDFTLAFYKWVREDRYNEYAKEVF